MAIDTKGCERGGGERGVLRTRAWNSVCMSRESCRFDMVAAVMVGVVQEMAVEMGDGGSKSRGMSRMAVRELAMELKQDRLVVGS